MDKGSEIKQTVNYAIYVHQMSPFSYTHMYEGSPRLPNLFNVKSWE